MIDLAGVWGMVVAGLWIGAKWVSYLAVGGGLGFGVWWYVKYRRIRRFACPIYELRSDGAAHLTRVTVLERLPKDKRGQVFWQLMNPKVKVPAPPDSAIQNTKKKDYVNYLKFGEDYVPLVPTVFLGEKKKVTVVDEANPKRKVVKEVFEPSIKFVPMNYDVNLFRIEESLIRARKYKDKEGWWDKNKQFVAYALLIVGFIVLCYFGFQYVESIQALAAGKLDTTAGLLSKIYDKMGAGGIVGSPPVPPGY